MGKQAHEQGIVDQRIGRLDLAMVHIDDVGDFLERIKRYRGRQHDLLEAGRNAFQPQQCREVRKRINEEVAVLEEAEERKIERQGKQQQCAALTRLRESVEPSSGAKIHDRGSSHERSEEHTSELQSPCNLVCRLLLEKKKRRRAPQRTTL